MDQHIFTMENHPSLLQRLERIESGLHQIEAMLGERHTANHEWLDQQDLCRLLNVSKRTLGNYRRRGLLPFTSVGGKIFYRHSEINAILNRRHNRKERSR